MKQLRENNGTEVAIIGLSFEFPGARDIDELWSLLLDGRSAMRRFSRDELAMAGVSPALMDSPGYVPVAAVLDEIDRFDAEFFGMSAQEAALLDPQQRKILEQCWRALENAGRVDDRASVRTGVFAGVSPNTYLFNTLGAEGAATLVQSPDLSQLLAGEKDFAATRVAYRLGLRGPAQTIQTACSTGLVLVHAACRALQAGECDVAIAAAASVRVPHHVGYIFREGSILSPDGACRPFDESANGCVPGSGAAAIVLKRLDDALRDGDTIRAVILGSAVNNDGDRKVGFAAPSVDGQAEVIRLAHAAADVEPCDIDYIEAHGTGTRLGDPVEVAALAAAFRGDERRQACGIGSIKGHIGHLDAAAGLAGLIKTVVALMRHVLPPSLNFEHVNPEASLEGTPFYVVQEAMPWRAALGGRIAGVSAFGVGGTNAHVVLAEAPPDVSTASEVEDQVLVLSAASPTALRATGIRLACYLSRNQGVALADVARTLLSGREVLACRLAIVAQDTTQASDVIRQWAEAEAPCMQVLHAAASNGNFKVLAAAGRWVSGEASDEDLACMAHALGRRVPLPGVVLQPVSHWRAGVRPSVGPAIATGSPVLPKPNPAVLYAPVWYCEPIALGVLTVSAEPPTVLLVHDESAFSVALAGELKHHGRLVEVSAGQVPSLPEAIEDALAHEGLGTVHLVLATGMEPIRADWSMVSVTHAQRRLTQLLEVASALAKCAGVCTQLGVVTTGRFQVTGSESMDVVASLAEGACLVYPQEMSGLRCASYDFDARELGASPAVLAGKLAAELRLPRHGTFAPRGRVLWRRGLDRIDTAGIQIQANLSSTFGDGTVVVGGGFGGIGSALVRALLQEPSRRVALLARPVIPSAAARDWPEEMAYLAGEVEATLATSPIHLFHDQSRYVELLNQLCASRVAGYLAELDFVPSTGSFPREMLFARAAVLPSLVRMLEFFIRVMKEEGCLREAGGMLEWCGLPPDAAAGDEARRELLELDPTLVGTLNLLERCAELYRPALSGRIEPISVLYPEGGSRLMKPAAESMIHRSTGLPLTQALAAWVAHLARATAREGKPFRILEFGSGNGLLTRPLVDALGALLPPTVVQYFVTDLGRSFVEAARERHAQITGLDVVYRVYDITLDPTAQGLETGSFDLVCGLNVVHATPDVVRTLSQLRLLLKPQGRLAIIESVLEQRWVDMVAGVTEGWWLFADHRQSSPLMSGEDWIRAMHDAGLQDAVALPGSSWRDRSDCALILSHEGQGRQPLLRHEDAVVGADDRVRVYEADLRDPAQVVAAVDRVREEMGPITGVIQSAGRISGALAHNLTDHDVNTELGARVGGALALALATRDDPVAMFAMSSSLNAVIGGEGQAAYVAANAMLAGLGRALAVEGRRSIVVHWDRWVDVGLGVAFQERYRCLTGHEAPGGLSEMQAIDGLARAMALGLTEVAMVGADDLDQRLSRYAQVGTPAHVDHPTEDGPAPTVQHGQAQKAAQCVLDLCRRQLGIANLSLDQCLIDAGVDSLDVLELQAKLEREFGLRVFSAALISEPLHRIVAACLDPTVAPATVEVLSADLYVRFRQGVGLD